MHHYGYRYTYLDYMPLNYSSTVASYTMPVRRLRHSLYVLASIG